MMRLALALVLLLAPAAPGPGAEWRWPTALPHPVVRPFMLGDSVYAAGHRGLDIGAPVGAVVRAPAAGVVHFAGVVVDRPVLSIRHGDGLISSYEPVMATVAEGEAVTAGQEIGTLAPGHCENGCLHFGVRELGEYISPLLLLGDPPRAVLLPTRGL